MDKDTRVVRGNIRQLGPDKWRVQAFAGRDPITRKQHRPSQVVEGTLEEAEAVLTRILNEVDEGRVTNRTRTLGSAIDAFLAHKALSVESTTMKNYRCQASYIGEAYRKLPIVDVDVEHLEALYAHLATRGNKRSGAGLSPKAIKGVHGFLRGVFTLARRRGWVLANPVPDAERPRVPHRAPTPVDTSAVPRLMAAAADVHPDLPDYIRISLCIGGRRSEIHALRWSGVNFERGTVTLREAYVPGDGEWVLKPRTKTGEQRVVHVDAGTLDVLRRRHAAALEMAMECEVRLPPTAFVFSDAANGTVPWNPNTTRARFQRACVQVGLPKSTRIHDLRHTMATYLLDQGVPLPVVAGRLGHSDNSTTLDVYTGRIPVSDQAAAEVMGRLLDGAI